MCLLDISEVNVQAFLGIGSNQGDREALIVQALHDLNETHGISVINASSIYETSPWGIENQSRFLNQVVKIHTVCTPRELLSITQQIEKQANRQREIDWGPRTLDIDLLIYGDLQISESDLHIPHRFLHARRFVLEPLVEIEPKLWIPGWQMTAEELLDSCTDKKAVHFYQPKVLD